MYKSYSEMSQSIKVQNCRVHAYEANATLTRGVHASLQQQIISTELSLARRCVYSVYPYGRASAGKRTWRLDVALEKNRRQSVHGKHARTTNRSIYCSARAFQFAALIIYHIISCIGIYVGVYYYMRAVIMSGQIIM